MSVDEDERSCPVCGTIFMSRVTEAMMGAHINACLDGGATASAGVGGGVNPAQTSLPTSSDTSAVPRTAPDLDELFGTTALGSGGNCNPTNDHTRAAGAPPPAVTDMSRSATQQPREMQNSKNDALALILAVFPGIPAEFASQMLDACGGDPEQAMGLIEGMRGEEEAEQRRLAQKQREQQEQQYKDQEERYAKERKRRLRELWSGPVDVELIVYDLKPDGMSKHFGLGVYHSALIIAGKEFSFGGSPDPADAENPGTFVCTPESAAPVIKKRVVIGQTSRSSEEVFAMMDQCGKEDWKVGDYHLLSKNCNHFTAHLMQYLGEKAVISGRSELKQEYREAMDVVADGKTLARLSSSDLRDLADWKFFDEAKKDKEKKSELERRSSLPRCKEERKLVEKFQRRFRELAEEEAEKWKLPDWVNRAARLGDTVVPNFVYNKVVASETGQTPNEGNTSSEDKKEKKKVPSASSSSGGGGLVGAPSAVDDSENFVDDEARLLKKQQRSTPPPSSLPTPSSQIDPASVSEVQAILPEAEVAAIQNALQRSGGSVEGALNILLN